jgi:hypothetical protein
VASAVPWKTIIRGWFAGFGPGAKLPRIAAKAETTSDAAPVGTPD